MSSNSLWNSLFGTTEPDASLYRDNVESVRVFRTSEQQAAYEHNLRNAARDTPPKPPRPGDQPPRNYINQTTEKLNKVYDAYSAERNQLDKDISKLQEERRQLAIAMNAIQSALAIVGKDTQGELELDEAQLERDIQQGIMSSVSGAVDDGVLRFFRDQP